MVLGGGIFGRSLGLYYLIRVEPSLNGAKAFIRGREALLPVSGL